MKEQLQSRVARPVVEFFQHSDAVQAVLHLVFHARPHEPRADLREIDWEDGEKHAGPEAGTVAH